ncbi:mitochondrial enolase superfamily member 1 [Podargus strigoides]
MALNISSIHLPSLLRCRISDTIVRMASQPKTGVCVSPGLLQYKMLKTHLSSGVKCAWHNLPTHINAISHCSTCFIASETSGAGCSSPGAEILQNGLLGKKEREQQMLKHRYLACTRTCAWLGYSDQQLKLFTAALIIQKRTTSCSNYASRFKVKAGADLQDDICRCRFTQEMIGPGKIMVNIAFCYYDAGCKPTVREKTTEWVTKPAEFKPLWIKEPTFPDEDIHVQMGHKTISKTLALLGIGVATREHCHNRVIFKQLLQAKALSYLQIDSCRLGNVNKNLSVLLLAKNFQSKALQNAAAKRKSFSAHSPR